MNIWRTQGRITYVWDQGGGLPIAFTLTPAAGGSSLPINTRQWCGGFGPNEPQWHVGLDVPSSVPDGAYLLNGDPSLPFTVATRSNPLGSLTISPADDLYAAVATGKDLVLRPGTYVLPGDRDGLPMGPNQTIAGLLRYGAELVRQASGYYADRSILPADNFALRNLSFSHEGPGAGGVPWYVLHSNAYARNGEITNCSFYGADGYESILGEFNPPDDYLGGRAGLLVQDCFFSQFGLSIMSGHSMTFRCDFDNAGWSSLGSDQSAILDCRHRYCGRGTGHGLWRGDISNGLYAHLDYRDINTINGGGEVFYVEGDGLGQLTTAFHHNLAIGLRITNCDSGAIQFWYCHAHDNTFLDTQIDGGMGVYTYSPWPRNVSGNLFRFGEMRNAAGISFGPYGTNNTVDQFSFVNLRPGRGNEYQTQPPDYRPDNDFYYYAPRPVVRAGGTGNMLSNSRLVGIPSAWPSAVSPSVTEQNNSRY